MSVNTAPSVLHNSEDSNAQIWPAEDIYHDSDETVVQERNDDVDSFDEEFPVVEERAHIEPVASEKPQLQEEVVETDPQAGLRGVLDLINQYEKEPRTALEKVKAFIIRILPTEGAKTHLPRNLRGPNEVTSLVVSDLLKEKKWDFSDREIASVMGSRVDIADKKKWNETGWAVQDEVERWKIYTGLDKELEKLASTTSHDRLAEYLPRIVENYAAKNGRKMTPEEREVVLNHAQNFIAVDTEVLQNARAVLGKLPPEASRYNSEQIGAAVKRLGYANNPNRNEIRDEVVKMVAEQNRLARTNRAIEERLDRNLTTSVQNIGEYVDRNIAAYIAENKLNLTQAEIAELRSRFQAKSNEYAEKVTKLNIEASRKQLEQKRKDEGYYEAVNNIIPQLRTALQQGSLFEDRPNQYIDQSLKEFVTKTRYLSPHVVQQVRAEIERELLPEFHVANVARNVSVDLQGALSNPNITEEEVRNVVGAYLTEREGVTDENRTAIENLSVERIMRRLAVNKVEAERKRLEKQMARGEVNDVEKRSVRQIVVPQPESVTEPARRAEAQIISNERFRKLREEIEISRKTRTQSWGGYKKAA